MYMRIRTLYIREGKIRRYKAIIRVLPCILSDTYLLGAAKVRKTLRDVWVLFGVK